MNALLFVIAALIGLSLGLIGAGGAIVAVPAFVYLGGIQPTLASGYALFIITVASTVGSVQYIRNSLVSWRSVAVFGSTTMASIAIVRRFVLPSLPEYFVLAGGMQVQRDAIIMLCFALVLCAVGVQMIRSTPPTNTSHPGVAKLALVGIGVGTISGFLGVGGGFLITPALVLWARLDVRKAVGTSLALMALNSGVGVASDLSQGIAYNWELILPFTLLTTAGIIIGARLAHRINTLHIKRGFGWFVITLGAAVAAHELF